MPVERYHSASAAFKLGQMFAGSRVPGDTRGLGCVRPDDDDLVDLGVEEASAEAAHCMASMEKRDAEARYLDHARGLEKQGAWLVDMQEDDMWADFHWVRLALNLNYKLIGFICNASLQTLASRITLRCGTERVRMPRCQRNGAGYVGATKRL